MDANILVTAMVSGIGAGIVSAIGTVAALGVRVDWVKDTANRAHTRIDEHDKVLRDHERRMVTMEQASD